MILGNSAWFDLDPDATSRPLFLPITTFLPTTHPSRWQQQPTTTKINNGEWLTMGEVRAKERQCRWWHTTMTITVTPHTGGVFFHFIHDLLTNEPPAWRWWWHRRPCHHCHHRLSPPPPPRSCHITAITPSITTTTKMTATSPPPRWCRRHITTTTTTMMTTPLPRHPMMTMLPSPCPSSRRIPYYPVWPPTARFGPPAIRFGASTACFEPSTTCFDHQPPFLTTYHWFWTIYCLFWPPTTCFNH